MALPRREAGTVNWIAVSSSWIAAIAFRPIPGSTYGTIFLRAKKEGGPITGEYAYYNCPRFIWQQFQAAPSKGKAYWALLRNRYGEARVG